MARKTGKTEDTTQGEALDEVTPAQGDAASEGADSNPMDQVRDLLFGQEARAQRAEMDAMRTALSRQIERLEAKFTERLDRMSDQTSAELRALEESLAEEARARTATDDAVRSELAQTDAALAQSDARAQDAEEALRQALANEASALREALEAAMSAMSRSLAETKADLEDRKADRVAIAALLRGAADELAGSGDG